MKKKALIISDDRSFLDGFLEFLRLRKKPDESKVAGDKTARTGKENGGFLQSYRKQKEDFSLFRRK